MTVLPARPYDPVATLHANITDALNELRGAREINEHCPDADSQRTVDLCEWRLDVLLQRQQREEET